MPGRVLLLVACWIAARPGSVSAQDRPASERTDYQVRIEGADLLKDRLQAWVRAAIAETPELKEIAGMVQIDARSDLPPDLTWQHALLLDSKRTLLLLFGNNTRGGDTIKHAPVLYAIACLQPPPKDQPVIDPSRCSVPIRLVPDLKGKALTAYFDELKLYLQIAAGLMQHDQEELARLGDAIARSKTGDQPAPVKLAQVDSQARRSLCLSIVRLDAMADQVAAVDNLRAEVYRTMASVLRRVLGNYQGNMKRIENLVRDVPLCPPRSS